MVRDHAGEERLAPHKQAAQVKLGFRLARLFPVFDRLDLGIGLHRHDRPHADIVELNRRDTATGLELDHDRVHLGLGRIEIRIAAGFGLQPLPQNGQHLQKPRLNLATAQLLPAVGLGVRLARHEDGERLPGPGVDLSRQPDSHQQSGPIAGGLQPHTGIQLFEQSAAGHGLDQ